jgi:hypothetical protein
MDAFLWVLLPALVAVGTAILVHHMMQARMEVALAKERQALAMAQAKLSAQEEGLQDKIKAAEESAQRKAFDQFLTDFRVEERHYVRESKSHFVTRKSMILQERLFFRNIPLSNWVEHEMPINAVGDVNMIAENNSSVFSARALADHSGPAPGPGPKFLAQ